MKGEALDSTLWRIFMTGNTEPQMEMFIGVLFYFPEQLTKQRC